MQPDAHTPPVAKGFESLDAKLAANGRRTYPALPADPEWCHHYLPERTKWAS